MRTNEGASSKPKVRETSEYSKDKGIKLLSCKNYIQIATLNVRTIRTPDKLLELANNFNNCNLNILGIIDHKIVHEDDPVLIQQLDNCTLITSSAWRNSNGATSGGVGLLVSKKVEQALSDVRPINNRILMAIFNGNPNTTIVINYAPTEGSERAEDHYETLTNAVDGTPNHHMVIECGDYNAHLGKESAPYTYHETTNQNGKLLLDHATECNLHITNTAFKKRKGKLWTYISDMNNRKSQIDYILVNRQWKNSIHNCEAYNSFSSLGSDHRLLTAKIKLSLRMTKTPAKKKQYDWTALRNSKLQHHYTVTVRNRYAELCTDDDTFTERYGHFIQANAEATEKLIPLKPKNKSKNIAEDPRINEAREAVQKAFTAFSNNPTIQLQQQLQKEKSKLKEIYDDIQEKELDEMINQVEMADNKRKHGESWQLINTITGRKSSKRGILKGNTKEERVNKWFEHFSNLFGKEPVLLEDPPEEVKAKILNDIHINDDDFTLDEMKVAKYNLREGKTSGPDNIRPEVLKRCDLDDILLEFANKLLNDNIKPDQWSEIDMPPLPKSGDLSLTANYRGISLSSMVAKLVNKMILNRLQPKIDKHLRPNQNGFRPGRSTTSHILALRRLIEGVKTRNKKAIILYVDFRKAFDSIHRCMMMKILKAYDVPPRLLAAINKLHENTRARVITPDGET